MIIKSIARELLYQLVGMLSFILALLPVIILLLWLLPDRVPAPVLAIDHFIYHTPFVMVLIILWMSNNRWLARKILGWLGFVRSETIWVEVVFAPFDRVVIDHLVVSAHI